MDITPGQRPGLDGGDAPGLSCSPTQPSKLAHKEAPLDMPILIDDPRRQSLPPHLSDLVKRV